MKGPGTAFARGGIHLKSIKSGDHEILIPMPQIMENQVPLLYYIRCIPENGAEFSLIERDNANHAVLVKIRGEKDSEIRIEWDAVILFYQGDESLASDICPDIYKKASACAQSDDKGIMELASRLWPDTGETMDFLKEIQSFIKGLKPVSQPSSLDASAMLRHGVNWICTANANLGIALLRARNIPARSLAVIPVISQRLEMHRIIEYCTEGKWLGFDPSSLFNDIPMSPWHSVVMSTATRRDEEISMEPRLGAFPGAPYGQEAEIRTGGIILFGTDFFWTEAYPLSEFPVSRQVLIAVGENWRGFLSDGITRLRAECVADIKSSDDLLKALSRR